MAIYQIKCAGPGPHQPADGILGTSDRPPAQQADVRCISAFCAKPVDPTVTNKNTLEQRARAAYQSNTAFIGSTPTQAQALAQVKELTKQINGLIRLVLGDLDADS